MKRITFADDTGDIIVDDSQSRVKIFRGVALIDLADSVNAERHGWFLMPRATTDAERRAGLVRVSKL